MKRLLKKFFSSKRLPENAYRSILVDVSEAYGTDGCLNITFEYIICCKETNKSYKFNETFTDNTNISRSNEFFDFLEANRIVFTEYYNLVGLVFDTVLQYDFIGGKEVPLLTQKKMVSPPPKYW